MRMPSDPSSSVRQGLNCGAHSELGDRSRNEDSYAVRSWPSVPLGSATASAWLIAVADGLGGHPRGDEASRAAISAVHDFAPVDAASSPSDEDFTGLFHAAFTAVEALRSRGRDGYLMGGLRQEAQPATTLTIVTRFADDCVKVANLGDSRAYVVAHDGRLLFASAPHQSRSGYLLKCVGDHPFTAPDVVKVRLPGNPHGVIVACASDGVWGPLTRHGDDVSFAERLHMVRGAVGLDGQRFARQLTRDAVTASGRGADNATVCVVVL